MNWWMFHKLKRITLENHKRVDIFLYTVLYCHCGVYTETELYIYFAKKFAMQVILNKGTSANPKNIYVLGTSEICASWLIGLSPLSRSYGHPLNVHAGWRIFPKYWISMWYSSYGSNAPGTKGLNLDEKVRLGDVIGRLGRLWNRQIQCPTFLIFVLSSGEWSNDWAS